jgi:hypothetical protein
MSDPDANAPQAGAGPFALPANTGSPAAKPNRDRLRRLARLVADGEIAPASAARELSPEALPQLEAAVREFGRIRLVRFIALQIALDIHDKSDRDKPEHVRRGMPDHRVAPEQLK